MSSYTGNLEMQEIFVTLAEFLENVSDLPNTTLFRGHSSASYELKPSIGRHEYPGKNIENVEKMLFSRFKLKSQLYFNGDTELDWLIFARHYGLNTRILDWTKSQYVALYFALQNRSKLKHEPFSVIAYSKPPMKSYFDIREKSPFSHEDDIYFEPPTIDKRIASQNAFLSIHSNPFREIEDDSLIKFSFYPSLNSLIQIEKELISVGVSHATIFPGADGIAKHLNENPGHEDFGLHLRPEGPSWKPIPESMIGKTEAEYRKFLLSERWFYAILELQMSRIQDIIGIPVIFPNGESWLFHTFKPFEQKVTFIDQKGNQRKEFDLNEEEFRRIKVEGAVVKAIVPERFHVIRKIDS
jgi:hypothetical protein